MLIECNVFFTGFEWNLYTKQNLPQKQNKKTPNQKIQYASPTKYC